MEKRYSVGDQMDDKMRVKKKSWLVKGAPPPQTRISDEHKGQITWFKKL